MIILCNQYFQKKNALYKTYILSIIFCRTKWVPKVKPIYKHYNDANLFVIQLILNQNQ